MTPVQRRPVHSERPDVRHRLTKQREIAQDGRSVRPDFSIITRRRLDDDLEDRADPYNDRTTVVKATHLITSHQVRAVRRDLAVDHK